MAFAIVVTSVAVNSLGWIDRKFHSSIRTAIIEQLTFEPTTKTRNRKPLEPPIGEATWELRCGTENRFRVLYQVLEPTEENEQGVVEILVFGEKRGNQLWINGEVIDE